jgi:hypothetical protein
VTDLALCPFCGTAMLRHDHCFSHPQPAEGDCILRHYSFDKQKARDWNRRSDEESGE